MNYDRLWNALDALITELRKRGEEIPVEIIRDLRSAKILIQISKRENTLENLPRIESYLGNVESHLILSAQEKIGSKFVDHWTKKIDDARRMVYQNKELKSARRFVPGLPRGKPWLRIRVSKETPRKYIEKTANEERLSHRSGEGDWILVWGEREDLNNFIKKIKKMIQI